MLQAVAERKKIGAPEAEQHTEPLHVMCDLNEIGGAAVQQQCIVDRNDLTSAAAHIGKPEFHT